METQNLVSFPVKTTIFDLNEEEIAIESQSKESDNTVGTNFKPLSDTPTKILYCRCAFANVVPADTKNEVLERLCDSGTTFESVADLCEMSARKDDRLAGLIDGEGHVKIAACYPRAVKWLFHQAGLPFPDEEAVEVLNMREESAEAIANSLIEGTPLQSDTPES